MANEREIAVGSGWANAPSTSSEHNKKEYDEIAERYEAMVDEWEYDAPPITAGMLAKHLGSTDGKILDAACGTGLTGKALHERGFRSIVGVDISARSIELARAKNVYTDLQQVDLQALPMAFADNAFDGAQCVAAMAFLDEEPFFRELCRLIRPGGVALYSQRVDLYEGRNYRAAEDKLIAEGLWKRVETTDPRPYLPGHPDYKTDILVQFFAFSVL